MKVPFAVRLLFLIVSSHLFSAEITGTGHRFIASQDGKYLAIVSASGEIEWKYDAAAVHDAWLLANGNILFQTNYQNIVEVSPDKKIVWSYNAAKMNGNGPSDDNKKGRPVEVHAIQRLADGNTMIVESGPARILEVDKDGKIAKEIKLVLKSHSTHSDTRNVRKLANGHYLAAHENDGTVREYDENGKVVWEYEVPMFGKKVAGGHGPEAWGNHCYSALRLPNGNTLISTGNGHGVIEVTPAKEIAWQLTQDELPGIQLAWVCQLQVLKNGNIIIDNCHAGPKNPQIIEVTRDKKVVWSFKDHVNFGNAVPVSFVIDAEESIR
ncbi:MAG TPA: arylsulfotransferase family protein [Planctomycetota bacterium]|nr:arylsulfotransferase family protein [Planctomycetota bacterium]